MSEKEEIGKKKPQRVQKDNRKDREKRRKGRGIIEKRRTCGKKAEKTERTKEKSTM